VVGKGKACYHRTETHAGGSNWAGRASWTKKKGGCLGRKNRSRTPYRRNPTLHGGPMTGKHPAMGKKGGRALFEDEEQGKAPLGKKSLAIHR